MEWTAASGKRESDVLAGPFCVPVVGQLGQADQNGLNRGRTHYACKP